MVNLKLIQHTHWQQSRYC